MPKSNKTVAVVEASPLTVAAAAEQPNDSGIPSPVGTANFDDSLSEISTSESDEAQHISKKPCVAEPEVRAICDAEEDGAP